MTNILSEKDYQKFLLERLEQDNGFVIRKASNYDRLFAVDREMLFQFLNATQPDTMEYLRKIYKADLEDTIVSFINTETTKARGSLIEVLKHGIEISNRKLELMYTKPATTFNPELTKKYSQNIFSVMEEVWASDKERIDVVIFLNGLAIIAFELKCNTAGQSYQDAIYQFRTERSPKTRLFLFKAGTLVNFAMDLEEVYMTTRLAGDATFFLPFNMGNGHGVTAGAGNPAFEDKYSVSYMWEDILTKDTILDLISRFIFVAVNEKVDEATGKVKRSESLIFPRYHQLDAIRKLLADVRENRTAQNYLIQHSAGSGKTNTIAWLAHRLTSLHDADNKIIFDNVVIVTDRVVVDRQLQKAIMGMEHKAGLIRVMDDKCNSADLAIALNGNTKIIATTIQKFPFIVDSVKGLKEKHFAVIIDEAHSSTAGKDMAAVTMALGSGEEAEADVEDMISSEIKRNGKQANVSMFAFTATPKPTTIQLFGRLNPHGQREAFHVYSMKQAIEEGFILDVLQNYTEYATFFQINKEIEDDPRCKTNDAKRQIARFVELHETNIAQRVEVIVEHFRTTVMHELGGQAKAMVITPSRQSAVKYCKAFEEYVAKKGYEGIHALVAFSGKVKLPDDETEYTEAGLNGFPEDRLPKEFDTDAYQVLLVANKYQTGFDQPKLCAMYVDKMLTGVAAVQTLSRLNRICDIPGKRTFVVDFVNDWDTIRASFANYYEATELDAATDPDVIYDLKARLDGYRVYEATEVDAVAGIFYGEPDAGKVLSAVEARLAPAVDRWAAMDDTPKREFKALLRKFLRSYSFITQMVSLGDEELHRFFVYAGFLVKKLFLDTGSTPDLRDKVELEYLRIEDKGTRAIKLESEELHNGGANAGIAKEDEEERLSVLVEHLNEVFGTNWEDADRIIKACADKICEDEDFVAKARTNSMGDLRAIFGDVMMRALAEILSDSQDMFEKFNEKPDDYMRVMNEDLLPIVYRRCNEDED